MILDRLLWHNNDRVNLYLAFLNMKNPFFKIDKNFFKFKLNRTPAQSFSFDFDTGSADVWVASPTCEFSKNFKMNQK